MEAHTVISAFRYKGELVEPPCDWTPPNEEIAGKLIAAECLRPVHDTANRKPTTKKGRKQA